MFLLCTICLAIVAVGSTVGYFLPDALRLFGIGEKARAERDFYESLATAEDEITQPMPQMLQVDEHGRLLAELDALNKRAEVNTLADDSFYRDVLLEERSKQLTRELNDSFAAFAPMLDALQRAGSIGSVEVNLDDLFANDHILVKTNNDPSADVLFSGPVTVNDTLTITKKTKRKPSSPKKTKNRKPAKRKK